MPLHNDFGNQWSLMALAAVITICLAAACGTYNSAAFLDSTALYSSASNTTLSDLFKSQVRSKQSFTVILAALDNDIGAHEQKQIFTQLHSITNDQPGLTFKRISTKIEPTEDVSQECMGYPRAVQLLTDNGADAVIWGSKRGEELELYLTTAMSMRKAQAEHDIQCSHEQALPILRWDELKDIVALAIYSHYDAYARYRRAATPTVKPELDTSALPPARIVGRIARASPTIGSTEWSMGPSHGTYWHLARVESLTRSASFHEDWEPDNRRLVLTFLGNTWQMLGDDREGAWSRSVAFYKAAAATMNHDKAVPRSAEWLQTQMNLGSALLSSGKKELNPLALQEAVAVYKRVLTTLPDDTPAVVRARVESSLGNALLGLGKRGTKQHLHDALLAYDRALMTRGIANVPTEQARIKANRAAAMFSLARRESQDDDLLVRSIASYRSTLPSLSNKHNPLERSAAMLYLGDALLHLSTRNKDVGPLREAIASYEDALTILDQRVNVQKWALAHSNRGRALLMLKQRDEGTKSLSKAIEAFENAREQITRQKTPLVWAAIHGGLGEVLLHLGQVEGKTARLHEAVNALRTAQKVYSREQFPLEWARSQEQIGQALLQLSYRAPGGPQTNEAIDIFTDALKVFSREKFPMSWARCKEGIGKALLHASYEQPQGLHARKAVDAFRDALTVYSQKRFPMSWAHTQTNIGEAFFQLGLGESDPGSLESAVDALSAALTVYSRERNTIEWARTQMALGKALLQLGKVDSTNRPIEAAIDALQKAVDAYSEDEQTLALAVAQTYLGDALSLLARRSSNVQLHCDSLLVNLRAWETLRSTNSKYLPMASAKVVRSKVALPNMSTCSGNGELSERHTHFGQWFGTNTLEAAMLLAQYLF